MTSPFLTQRELARRYGVSVSAVRKWREQTRRGHPFGPPWIDSPTMFQPSAPRIKYRLADILAWEVSAGVTPITTPQENQ